MAGITSKSLGQPDETITYEHGSAVGVQVGDSVVWRSNLSPGWTWDADIKPMVGDAESCPLHHREYVVSGTIRYVMDDGTELVAHTDDHLLIEPGHRAYVEGDEPCVLIDW